MTYVARVDIKGMVPAVVINTGLKGIVETVNRAVDFFEEEAELFADDEGGEGEEGKEEGKDER